MRDDDGNEKAHQGLHALPSACSVCLFVRVQLTDAYVVCHSRRRRSESSREESLSNVSGVASFDADVD